MEAATKTWGKKENYKAETDKQLKSIGKQSEESVESVLKMLVHFDNVYARVRSLTQNQRCRSLKLIKSKQQMGRYTHTHTHTHTHPFNGPLSRTTRVSRYQKGEPIWILLKQETVSGSGISWAICKSAPRSR